VAERDVFELLPALEGQLPDIAGGLVAPLEGRLETIAGRLDELAGGLTEPVAGGREGHQELERPADPLAGAELVYTVPGEWIVRPLSVMVTLTTSATAGERAIVLEWRDADGVRYAVAGTDVTVPASSAQAFNFQVEAAEGMWPVAGAAIVPMPSLFTWPAFAIAVRIIDGDAGDQLSSARLVVEKWTTAPVPLPTAASAKP
jgi:hypothetical protein